MDNFITIKSFFPDEEFARFYLLELSTKGQISHSKNHIISVVSV